LLVLPGALPDTEENLSSVGRFDSRRVVPSNLLEALYRRWFTEIKLRLWTREHRVSVGQPSRIDAAPLPGVGESFAA